MHKVSGALTDLIMISCDNEHFSNTKAKTKSHTDISLFLVWQLWLFILLKKETRRETLSYKFDGCSLWWCWFILHYIIGVTNISTAPQTAAAKWVMRFLGLLCLYLIGELKTEKLESREGDMQQLLFILSTIGVR